MANKNSEHRWRYESPVVHVDPFWRGVQKSSKKFGNFEIFLINEILWRESKFIFSDCFLLVIVFSWCTFWSCWRGCWRIWGLIVDRRRSWFWLLWWSFRLVNRFRGSFWSWNFNCFVVDGRSCGWGLWSCWMVGYDSWFLLRGSLLWFCCIL